MTCPSQAGLAAIEAEDLVFRYPDGTDALRGLSLRVEQGESVCLAGPNGAGKSTLLLVLAGLLHAQGTVRIGGGDPAVNRQVGLVFQDADDQLFCPTLAEDAAFGPRNQKLSETEVAQRIADSLAATGLTGFEKRSAHRLSGGEKKRAAIAAVLACLPEVFALDEPWANLDARGARAVTEIIRASSATRVVASQDLYRASEVCTRMVVLDKGGIVADGAMETLLADKPFLETHGLEFGGRCRFCPERDAPRRTRSPQA